MVNFSLFDNSTQQVITNFDANSGLPDDVSMTIWGPFIVESTDYTTLTGILNGTPHRSISSITVKSFSELESPEFLAFLVLVFNKTPSLKFSASLTGNYAFSCLMSTLFHTDGIRKLDISERMISTEQSKLLFAGIGASPCLDSFRLSSRFENRQESANLLIQAVRQNQSLTFLDVDCRTFDHVSFRDLLKEVARKQGMRVFRYNCRGTNTLLAVFTLQDALCHSDCKLEQLDLVGIIPSTESPGRSSVLIRNSSVRTLKISLAQTPQMNMLHGGYGTIKLFSSLVTLDLSRNGISWDLWKLDDILVGGGNNPSLLQSLVLNGNRIDGRSIQKFAHKLPRMKSLRNLELASNPFLHNSPQGCLILREFLWKNTHLERLRPVLPKNNCTNWSEYVTALNRAGRGPITSLAADISAPAGLWSLIVERAATIKYYSQSDVWGEPTSTTLRADTTFWILREMMTNVLG